MTHSLDDLWRKLDRADTHLQLLYKELGVGLDSHRQVLESKIEKERESKPKGTQDPRPWISYTLRITEVPEISKDTSLLIGEILHHYRGTLDHLAWLLVPSSTRRKMSWRDRFYIGFPMARSRKGFRANVADRKIPGTSPEVRTLVEQYQPYRRSTRGRSMKYLRDLSAVDKHRFIIPVYQMPGKMELNFKFKGGDLVDRELMIRPRQEIKRGTKIQKITLAASRKEPEVRVQGEIRIHVCFPHSLVRPAPPYTVLPVQYVLNNIKETCAEILSEFERRSDAP